MRTAQLRLRRRDASDVASAKVVRFRGRIVRGSGGLTAVAWVALSERVAAKLAFEAVRRKASSPPQHECESIPHREGAGTVL
jgi:hypothetical protein